jgi:hypothetical protein
MSRIPPWTLLVLRVVPLVLLAIAIPRTVSAQQPFSLAAELPVESRQFDFWVGEWDVNLRARRLVRREELCPRCWTVFTKERPTPCSAGFLRKHHTSWR